jgi:hypothetical protein
VIGYFHWRQKEANKTKQFDTVQINILLPLRQFLAEIPCSKDGYRASIPIWGYRVDAAHPFGRALSPVLTDVHSDAQFTLHIFEVSLADLDAQNDLDDVLIDLAYYQGLPRSGDSSNSFA